MSVDIAGNNTKAKLFDRLDSRIYFFVPDVHQLGRLTHKTLKMLFEHIPQSHTYRCEDCSATRSSTWKIQLSGPFTGYVFCRDCYLANTDIGSVTTKAILQRSAIGTAQPCDPEILFKSSEQMKAFKSYLSRHGMMPDLRTEAGVKEFIEVLRPGQSDNQIKETEAELALITARLDDFVLAAAGQSSSRKRHHDGGFLSPTIIVSN